MGRLVLLAATALLCTAADAPKVTIAGGRTYAFPPAAFMDGEVEYKRQGSLLLLLAWPEVRPLTPEEASAWPQRDTIRILTVNGAPRDGDGLPDGELLADMPKKLAIAENLDVDITEGSRDRIPPPRADPDPLPVGSAVPGGGMKRVRAEVLVPGSGKRDVFAEEPLAHPHRFISCAEGGGSTVDPECFEDFVAAGMSFKVSYRRALVPHWREIEARTIAFFRDHEVHP